MPALSGCPSPIATADAAANCINLGEWNIRGGLINSLAELIAPLWQDASATADCSPLFVTSAGGITIDETAGCEFLGVHVGTGHVLTANPTACLLVAGGVTPCTYLKASGGVLVPTTSDDPDAIAIALASGNSECVLSMLLARSTSNLPSCAGASCDCGGYITCENGELVYFEPPADRANDPSALAVVTGTTSSPTHVLAAMPKNGRYAVTFTADVTATGGDIQVVQNLTVNGGSSFLTVRTCVQDGCTETVDRTVDPLLAAGDLLSMSLNVSGGGTALWANRAIRYNYEGCN